MPPVSGAIVEQSRNRNDLLDAAERLFYTRGIQAVSMDQIRAECGLTLKRIYQLYPGKEQLVVAFLCRRDIRWRAQLRAYVETVEQPAQRVLAVFDWLYQWFAEPDFRGCAWINAYGELGATTPAVADTVRKHKQAFRRDLSRLLRSGGYPSTLAPAIYLLAEGAMITAAIHENPRVALQARAAAIEVITGATQAR